MAAPQVAPVTSQIRAGQQDERDDYRAPGQCYAHQRPARQSLTIGAQAASGPLNVVCVPS